MVLSLMQTTLPCIVTGRQCTLIGVGEVRNSQALFFYQSAFKKATNGITNALVGELLRSGAELAQRNGAKFVTVMPQAPSSQIGE